MIGAFIFVVAAVAIVGLTARHLIHPLTSAKGGLGSALSKINQNNARGGYRDPVSSAVPYSPNPLYYPRDVYTVLFDPFWFNARSITQIIASIENTLIFAVVVYSLNRLRYLFRALRPAALRAHGADLLPRLLLRFRCVGEPRPHHAGAHPRPPSALHGAGHPGGSARRAAVPLAGAPGQAQEDQARAGTR